MPPSSRKRSKSGAAVDGIGPGADTEGVQFASASELWAKEAGDEAARASWYSKGLAYWQALPASVDTVLGGYAAVSPRDCAESDAFLRAALPRLGDTPRPRLAAADLGAGVGRVTRGLLLQHFDDIEVVEPVRHYLDKAEADIGRSPSGGGADGRPPQAVAFTCAPLQTWSPDRGSLDCVWVQWCAGHLTDDDFVAFMLRAAAGLRPGGCVVLKENNAREGFLVDKEDSSLTRSDAHFRQLLARCVSALRLERVKLQTGFPAELFAVRMYLLRKRE